MGRMAVCVSPPLTKTPTDVVPPPMSATTTPNSRSAEVSTASADASGPRSPPPPPRPVHPPRVAHAVVAINHEAPREEVDDLPVARRQRGHARRLDDPLHVGGTDLVVPAADRDDASRAGAPA